MRFLGHPLHAMVIHFPIALWPAHLLLHVFAKRLPEGPVSAIAFWILCAGSALGWLAAFLGAADLVKIAEEKNALRMKVGLVHAAVNTGVLLGFTVLTCMEYAQFPSIRHGAGFLAAEAALLAALGVGNYFGGSLVWTAAA